MSNTWKWEAAEASCAEAEAAWDSGSLTLRCKLRLAFDLMKARQSTIS